MSLIIIGEPAARTIEKYPGFVAQHPELGWYNMRGMRNRIAHGYFDINLAVVWDTIQVSLPELLNGLPALLHAAQATEEGQGGL